MIVLVCGGRDYQDREELFDRLYNLDAFYHIEEIVHGGAKGADSLGGEWAKENNRRENIFHANWDVLGRSAGIARNREMGNYLRTKYQDESKNVLVVTCPGGKGTEDMKNYAKSIGIKVMNYE